MDSIQNAISPDLLRTVAAHAGGSPEGIQKGLETGAATMLGTLAIKAGDTGFLNQIFSMLGSYGTQAMSAGAGAGGAATAAVKEAGGNFLTTLFGGNLAAVEDKIAQASGVSAGGGATILASAAPLVMGALASRLGGGANGLVSALSAELPSLKSKIPTIPGLHLPNFGAGAAGAAASARAAAAEKAGGGWMWPVLLLGAILIAGLVWYFNRGTDKPMETATTAVTTAATTATAAVADTAKNAGAAIDDATKAAWAKLGELFKRKLPNGVELNIPKLGVENKLVDWIESSNPVDKTTWFDFDRLLFATGSATLNPASEEQLKNVSEILKAYPKVKVRIGGYTDNQGSAAGNLKLSEARATAVVDELATLGVDKTRMDAKGYGAEHPVGDNNTEEGRQMNRRISLRVTEK